VTVVTLPERHYYQTLFRTFNKFSGLVESVNSSVSNLETTTITKGGPIKDYKLRISLGEEATTSLFVSSKVYQTDDVFVAGYHGHEPSFPGLDYAWSEARGMPDFLPGLSVDGVSVSKADTAALTKLSSRINDAYTSFQTGVFVGELKETVHLVRHPLQALQHGLIGHLKLVVKRAKRIRHGRVMAKMVTQSWLEFQYGVRPLLADIDNGAEALSEFVIDPLNREFKTVTAHGDDEAAADKSNVLCTTASGYANAYANVIARNKATVKYLVCLGVTPSVRSCAFGKLGITFSSFVPTLWELIPYSFVVDYFSNVGNVIQGLANISASRRWAVRWVITESQEEAKNFSLGKSVNPAILQVCSGGYSSVKTRTISRVPYLGTFVPDLRFEVPGLASLKWANLAALTAQLALARRVVQTPSRNKLILLRKGTF